MLLQYWGKQLPMSYVLNVVDQVFNLNNGQQKYKHPYFDGKKSIFRTQRIILNQCSENTEANIHYPKLMLARSRHHKSTMIHGSNIDHRIACCLHLRVD